MKKLIPFTKNPKSETEIWAEVIHDHSNIEIHFWAKNLKKIHTSPSYSLEHIRNWGLWDFDVVECFLYLEKNRKEQEKTPYYELQLSPLGQRFCLVIEAPRKTFYSPFHLDFEGKNTIKETAFGIEWRSQINIDLPQANEAKLWGNLCACLGPKEGREYFALNWNYQGVLDFHRPDSFVPLSKTGSPL